MAVTLNASASAGLITTADTSTILQLQTGGTTAVTVDASQRTAFVAGTAALPAITTTGDTNTGIYFPAADTIAFVEGGVESMRITPDGNVGIGVTPSATWTSSARAIQLGGFNSIFGYTNNVFRLANNAIFTASNETYGASSIGATYYQQYNGAHSWYNAASGTAGNTISFTQAMSLTADGNLALGNTTSLSATSGRVDLTINGTSSSMVSFGTGGARKGYVIHDSTDLTIANESTGVMRFLNSTERARITSGGLFLTGGATSALINESSFGSTSAGNTATFKTTGGAGTNAILVWNAADSGTRPLIALGTTAASFSEIGVISTNGSTITYGTGSDYRLKDNIQPLEGSLSKVMQLNPVSFVWKNTGIEDNGFIAHELQEVCPNAVVGEKDATEMRQVLVSSAVEAVYEEREVPVYQNVDASFLVATLTAAIQEQQAIIQTLTDRITALEGTTP